MQLETRIKKLETSRQLTGICECKRETSIDVYDDSNMTAREVLKVWDAEIQPCAECSRPMQHFVFRFAMCQCEENLDLRIDIPNNWSERDDQEYWRNIQTRKCEKCGQPLQYGRLSCNRSDGRL